MVATKRALDHYRELDNSFAMTRESQLLDALAEDIEAGEQEKFADDLFNYDKLSKLDKWKTTIMLRVKSVIDAQEEDFS